MFMQNTYLIRKKYFVPIEMQVVVVVAVAAVVGTDASILAVVAD